MFKKIYIKTTYPRIKQNLYQQRIKPRNIKLLYQYKTNVFYLVY